jgi:DNA-binding transcriptional LysR family regulator
MQGDPATLQSRLHVRDIELAIGRVPDTVAAEAFETKVLFQEPVFVTSRQNNKLTRRRKVSLAEIAGEAWSLPPPGAIGHSALKAAFDAAGLNMPRSTVVTFSLQMHCALMATGGYLGLLPGSMLHFNAKRLGLAVVPVDVRLRPGPAGIFRLRNRTISPVADIFMRSAQDVAQVLKLGMR